MTDANNTVECRYVADRDEWAGWQLPSDKGNSRAQLRRMIEEWQQQRQILSELAAINPDIHKALAKVMAAYELMQRATVTIAIAPPAPDEQQTSLTDSETDSAFDFEESVPC
jgi:hypothetical protein